MNNALPAEHLPGRKTAYAILFLQGLGNLFPWNSFITAAHYFSMRLCGSPFQNSFENYLSVTTMLSQCLGLWVSVRYLQHLPLKCCVLVSILISTLVMIGTSVLVVTEVSQMFLFNITVLSCCLIGLCSATSGGGLFGLSGCLPPSYTGALMSGQALGGLVVSLFSMLTIWLGGRSNSFCNLPVNIHGKDECPMSIDYGALSFFVIACVILCLCLLSFVGLFVLPFTKFHEGRVEKDRLRCDSIDDIQPSEVEAHSEERVAAALLRGCSLDDIQEVSAANPVFDCEQNGGTELTPLNSSRKDHTVSYNGDNNSSSGTVKRQYERSDTVSVSARERQLRIFRKIRPAALAVFGTFLCTLSLFPSLTVKITSQYRCQTNSTLFDNDLFVPSLFVLFNVSDFMGRMLAGVSRLGVSSDNIWVPVVLRFLFVPLFLFCRVMDSQLPLIFESDAWPLVFMVLFGLSNGFLSTVGMMIGPQMVSPRKAPLAGTIMMLSLNLGLLFGAACSFPIVQISLGTLY